jgi:pyruvate formate lyase activating enzyme
MLPPGILCLMSSEAYALTPFTLQDYPGCCACIVWVSGCNMRCSYCHNPQIVLGTPQLPLDEVQRFLEQRSGLLDAVVFSGGEATSWPELPGLMRYAKQLGYAIKLDTNGLRPDVLTRLLDDQLLDAVALDYKAPFNKFRHITRTTAWQRFRTSLALLCRQPQLLAEIRTTVHTSLLNEDDINTIIADLMSLDYTGNYALQNYDNNRHTPTLAPLPPQTRLLDLTRINRPAGLNLIFRNFRPASH